MRQPAPVANADGGPRAAAEAKFFDRVYPAHDIPANAHDVSRETFEAIERNGGDGEDQGRWKLIGPSVALVPELLTYTGSQYITSGRITALAIGPRCTEKSCRIWVGAAGGGIWRTERGLSETPKWRFISASFHSNAIGSLVVDPTDPTGDTLYAGTGESNTSVDSCAGVGIYKTRDGGDHWTFLAGSKAAANGRAISSIAIDPTDGKKIWIGTTRATRGITSVTGGGVTLNPAYPGWGLWKSTDGGTTFMAVVTNSSTAVSHPEVGIRGVQNVILDPRNPSTVYFSAMGRGVRRISALDAPVAPAVSTRVFFGNTTGSNHRTTFDITIKNGKTRMYVGTGDSGSPASSVWRHDNLDQPAAALGAGWIRLTSTTSNRADPGYSTYNFCTGQCWYDINVFTPKGHPDRVFVLGSFQYGEYWRVSNSRGVLLSTTAGDPDPANNNRTFTDVSWDATSPDAPNGIHPDQHPIVVSPSNPNIFFEGSDGGLMRSDGNWEDISSLCSTQRGYVPGTPNYLACTRLLSRVPRKLISMNAGLSTLQFQSLSVSPWRPFTSLMGGTQDNGTLAYTGSNVLWPTSINGDGGQSGYDAANDDLRFHTYYGPYIDVNWKGAEPTGWVWVSDIFDILPENWNFYVPIISDPLVSGSMFVGQQHVWRTKDSGGDRNFLETYCSETQPAPGPAPHICGDWVPIGGAYGSPVGDLTSTFYGPDRISAFDYIATVSRSSGDKSTMWVGTNTGRLFLSRNANAEPAGAVAYTRLDNATTPPRFISGIAIDPKNPNRAFVSYTGYSAVTPATPGHVFEVLVNPVTNTVIFTDLEAEGASGDLPINGIVRDDVTGNLYAATDFGVLRYDAERGAWGSAGRGLPKVEVAGLTIHSGKRVLYAATHGRSAWRLMLDGSEREGDDEHGGDGEPGDDNGHGERDR
jgi:hypothetical protein